MRIRVGWFPWRFGASRCWLSTIECRLEAAKLGFGHEVGSSSGAPVRADGLGDVLEGCGCVVESKSEVRCDGEQVGLLLIRNEALSEVDRRGAKFGTTRVWVDVEHGGEGPTASPVQEPVVAKMVVASLDGPSDRPPESVARCSRETAVGERAPLRRVAGGLAEASQRLYCYASFFGARPRVLLAPENRE